MHPSVPANSLQELILHLRANPGKLSYASQGNGSTSHIATEMLKSLTQTSIVHIPYRGSGQVVQDLLAGRVQIFVATPPSVVSFIQSGKLRALAITGPQRHPSLPNVPTTTEAGLKDLDLDAWVGIFGPSAMDAGNVKKLSAAIKTALESPQMKERATSAGIELHYLSPGDLDALVKRDTLRWARTIKDAGIKPD
nr:tripartite tricarboxylate transporter substrate binding protein [Variovorax sp. RA8]